MKEPRRPIFGAPGLFVVSAAQSVTFTSLPE